MMSISSPFRSSRGSRRAFPRRPVLFGMWPTLLLLLLVGCAGNRFDKPRIGTSQRGIASWYGEPFHGRATASGEIYDMHGLTAAHRELPLGTVVHVRNLDNGRTVTVRVNDRGPFIRGRVLDLSYGAAQKIGLVGPGTAKIELRVTELGSGPPGPNMSTRFTVQVGAFQEEINARRLLDELLPTYPDAKIIHDGRWHRVRVGKFRRQQDAEAVQRKLSARGYSALVLAIG